MLYLDALLWEWDILPSEAAAWQTWSKVWLNQTSSFCRICTTVINTSSSRLLRLKTEGEIDKNICSSMFLLNNRITYIPFRCLSFLSQWTTKMFTSFFAMQLEEKYSVCRSMCWSLCRVIWVWRMSLAGRWQTHSRWFENKNLGGGQTVSLHPFVSDLPFLIQMMKA